MCNSTFKMIKLQIDEVEKLKKKQKTHAMTPATHLPDNSSLAICRMEKSERLFRHLMPNCVQGMACAKKTQKP